MKIIKIIDALHLTDKGVRAKTKNGKFQIVHLQQGDLDGACAVYSTMMMLILIKAVKHSDIMVNGKEYDKRYSIERLKKELLETKGLHRAGNYFFNQQYDGIKDMLERSFAKEVNVQHCDNKNIEADITEQINDNQPVLISFSIKGGGAHAVVAVGIETENEETTKILCLDPGYTSPKFTYWNSIIDLNPSKSKNSNSKYKYQTITESGICYFVQLEDILIISKR